MKNPYDKIIRLPSEFVYMNCWLKKRGFKLIRKQFLEELFSSNQNDRSVNLKTKFCPHCNIESEEKFDLDDNEVWRCRSCNEIILNIARAMGIIE